MDGHRLVDRRRPKTWSEFIGNDKAIATVRRVLARPGFDSGAFWISGPTGTGKTTLARLIAQELGAKPGADRIDFEGVGFTVDVARHVRDEILPYYPFGPCRVITVDESHAITSRAVQALLTMLDSMKPRTVWCFTTTETVDAGVGLFGNFGPPLLSRCFQISLTAQGLAQPFATYLEHVAQEEGINGRTSAQYLRLIQENHNNLRAAMNQLEMSP